MTPILPLALISSLLLCCVSTSAALPSVIAGPFVNPANGHTYFILESATWTESEASAVAMGGHLVTINDVAENQWVFHTFGTFGGVDRALWIGLTDATRENRFQWASGAPFTFAFWSRLEPNNSGGAGYEEDYVYIIQRHSLNPDLVPGEWNDVPEDGRAVPVALYGVVEIGTDVPPPRPPSRFQRPRFTHPSTVLPGQIRAKLIRSK
ncbi:MAG TPA: C-type lectin domain-containing protein [Methylomirabilota bacterium]|nr:C-type lectin domain-containing protein [Methylomirabilota bacterium]